MISSGGVSDIFTTLDATMCRSEPQITKVFERSLRSLGHLDGDEGDDLLGKTVPSAIDSHPLHRLHGAALWESGREGNASLDELGSPSRVFMCI
jgi:hypothetical protein